MLMEREGSMKSYIIIIRQSVLVESFSSLYNWGPLSVLRLRTVSAREGSEPAQASESAGLWSA